MGDIEATFCHVKVPGSQRSFLRYLWWNNNDLNGELVDYDAVKRRWRTSLLIDFQKNLPSPIVGLTCLVHFWSKMVERSKRDMGPCLHVYPAG